jgi:hypothetical protein
MAPWPVGMGNLAVSNPKIFITQLNPTKILWFKKQFLNN